MIKLYNYIISLFKSEDDIYAYIKYDPRYEAWKVIIQWDALNKKTVYDAFLLEDFEHEEEAYFKAVKCLKMIRKQLHKWKKFLKK